MGDMSDFALDQMADFDEMQTRYTTFEEAQEAGVEELLYSYVSARYPSVFDRLYPRSRRMPKITKQAPVTRKTVKSKGSIASRIQSLDDCVTKFKLLVYGRSGTGKTRLFGTFPKKALLIRAENGIASIKGDKGIDVYPRDDDPNGPTIKSVEQMVDILDYLTTEDHGYESVGLDSASALADTYLANILGLKELPPQKSWGLASRDQYGQCGLQLKECFRRILALDANVCIIAGDRNFNDEGGGELQLAPTVGAALTPSVAGWLNYSVQYIGQTFIRAGYKEGKIKLAGKVKVTKTKTGENEFCLRTGPHEVFTTKFRVPRGRVLPDVIVDPDFDKIAELIGE